MCFGHRVCQLVLFSTSLWLQLLASTVASGEPVQLIAHRGGVVNEENIENSLAALEGAVDRGYWMIEADLRESKDGRAVVHHDTDFQRFYGDPRKLGDMTWDEIRELRSQTGGHRPLLFHELASACRGKMCLMLDLKGPNRPKAYYQAIESALRDNGLLKSTLIIGVPQAKRYFKGRVRISVQQDGLRSAIARREDVARLYFLFERGGRLNAETIRLARQAGAPVVAGINTFHYATEQHVELGRAEIHRLRRLGVRKFQIDSVYDSVLTAAADDRLNLVFCCHAENDLYRVMTGHGMDFPRHDSAREAIDAAPIGAGVLILADGYPQKAVRIDPVDYNLAVTKSLRLYVEYPALLPGTEVGKPRRTRVERAVVTSDFFGRELAPLRIVAINGLHFVPVTSARSHIAAARVAGFDTAVYGLPRKTDPILFEHPRGNLLVSTTKLSHFVTGRYAPQDAWQVIWSGILAWLCPGARLPELTWEPLVRPAFGRDEPLPEDAEKQALRRGVEWFNRSKLLLHPSRTEEVSQAAGADGLVSTPLADAPVGDGSLGILEAPLSIIQHDGSQLQGVARRGDCTGESAMAIAFGGKVFGEVRMSRTAENLLDFWYFTSAACKKERGDPNHGAYGLIAWGITTPSWYVANYGDDNARLLMSSWATAALVGEDRWDELMMRCLLANLRTTGQLGFRGGRIDVPDLGKRGWEPFFRRRNVNRCPHYEAYLWACYLWAYQQTGYPLFYQRAETGLRMTMEQYTDGWRWTNGLAQEKARILLPLAWLVRVADTAEHRAWLRTAFDGLLALQQRCGAIREELGLSGRGSYPPPATNEEYGGNEASLIQQNGDPVCDLLYTTNFAFLGLHEAAAAAGEKDMVDAEERLAEFLCRIQIRSDVQPALDGGWFRAFDFKRWEHWGSNADAGWGAWAIESGWTQGWITSVLAMRQMHTSLWDLTKESRIERHFDKYRRQMLPDEIVTHPAPAAESHSGIHE